MSSQALISASPDHGSKKTFYNWIAGDGKPVQDALSQGKTFLSVSQEPLEVWTDNLDELIALQRRKCGVIVRKIFTSPDIVMSPETLGMDRKYLVRSLSETTRFNIGTSVQTAAGEGWNPVASTVRKISVAQTVYTMQN